MKKRNTDRLLSLTFIISLLTIITVEFILCDIPEVFDGGAKLGEFLVSASISYIAAYFFYIITIHLPAKHARKNIEEHVAHLINLILFYLLKIMQDATNDNIKQFEIKTTNISEEKFKSALKGVFMNDDLKNFRVGDDGYNINVGKAVSNNILKLKETSDDLFKFSNHLEPELIKNISACIRNVIIESWVNRFNLVPIHIAGQILHAQSSDVSCYAVSLSEFHKLYKSIEFILLDNYKSTDVSIKYKENLQKLKNEISN